MLGGAATGRLESSSLSEGVDGLIAPALRDDAGNDSALFPAAGGRKAIDDWLTTALLEANARVCSGRVNPAIAGADLAADLAQFDFDNPREPTEVLRWTIDRMERGVVHVNHPRYFGLFNPAPTFPSQCADRIAAVFNPQLATATTSPFPVALEAFVIRAFAKRAFMPEGSAGHFATSGSECNATAVICALTAADPAFAHSGVRAFARQPVIYVSREAHLAWLKIAHQTGIGRNAVRLIDTDGAGRMSEAALRQAITADEHNGYLPIMIAATAGTTGAGMVDPLLACADIAKACGAWFHVDAAWGGALLVSDKLRPVLAGIERADSITIDAHKWLATTMGCGMFLTSRPAVLTEAFNVHMDCMPSNAPSVDPYVTTIQWSRRFLGLRLFLGLATSGWRGYEEHVEHAILLAAQLEQKLTRHGWTKLNDSAMAVLCMRPPNGARDARSIAQSIVASGAAWVTAIDFEGQAVIRACITSGESSEQDISGLADALIECAG